MAKKKQAKPSHKVGHTPAPKKTWYDKYYKTFLVIPFVFLIFALAVIGSTYASTGDFFYKGISLSGGYAVTITSDLADISSIDTDMLAATLQEQFPTADVVVRSQNQLAERIALDVETDITDETTLVSYRTALAAAVDGLTVEEIAQSSSISGSALGEAFVAQILQAMLVAFILMGIVVFIQFKTTIPSLAVILAAFSDIVVTLAIINLMGIKVSTAGIAAFLMLIGYSVDTDIMLSTRVLKSSEGSVNSRIKRAFTTGMTMNLTTIAAVTVGIVVSQSPVITQIMTIILVGLLVDMVMTWMQNASILKWYVEAKK